MARKTMWAVVGALLAFAPFASAATYGLTIQGALTYAKEMKAFGVDYDDEGPRVQIFLAMADNEATALDVGDFMDVTITLNGATFEENVKNSNINVVAGGVSDCTFGLKGITSGGEKDQRSVTFQVEVRSAVCTSPNGPNATITFELPQLIPGAPDAISASVVTDTAGGNDWPDTEDSGVTNRVCGTPAVSCAQLVDGVLRSLGATGRDVPLISFTNALTQSVTGSGSTLIDFGGGREDFAWPGQAHFANVRVGVTYAAACTTDDPAIPAGCVRQSDGKEFRISRNGEGRGEMYLAVFGDFREGDMVFLDMDGDGDPDRGEMFTLEDDGSMAGAFGLLSLAGNTAAQAGDEGAIDRAEGVRTTALRYRPNGDDPLRPSEFRIASNVVFEVQQSVANPQDRFDFETWRARDPGARATHSTRYTTIEDTQRSYAIPDLDGEYADLGNLRIKCEVSTECVVYLECDGGGMGEYWFGPARGMRIDGRATTRLNASAIAEALGVGEGEGWTNGLQCAVHSTRMISVQSLTRTGGVLVNHTYIARDDS